MGFQHELYEIDLERGDGAVIPPSKSPSRFYADSALSWSLLLLLIANIVDPLGYAGGILAALAILASTFGAITLIRRRPLARSSRKTLVLLLICWTIYAARLYNLRKHRHYGPLRSGYLKATKMVRAPTVVSHSKIEHRVHTPLEIEGVADGIKFVSEEVDRQPSVDNVVNEEREEMLDETRMLSPGGVVHTDGHEKDGVRNREMPEADMGEEWFIPDAPLSSSFV